MLPVYVSLLLNARFLSVDSVHIFPFHSLSDDLCEVQFHTAAAVTVQH